MSGFNETWQVGPHGPIEQVAPRLLTVAGEILTPLGQFPRRMTAAALSGGRAAVWSAMPLSEPAMAEIEALGRPAVLIVPGIAHRLDARAWLRRYPEMKVLCPPGARAKVEQAVRVDNTTGAILEDREVTFEPVSGTDQLEGALLIRRGRELTLVVNDILANVRHPHGWGAKVMARLMGFGVHQPQVLRVGRRMFVKDDLAFTGGLRRWARERDLRRIIVSHGDLIIDDPAGTLLRVAGRFMGQ